MMLKIAALVLLVTMQSHTPKVQSGYLSAYAIEPTVGTMTYRLESGQVELGHDVYLAVADCSRIGEIGEISIGGGEWLDYQVFDCLGADASYDWMAANNIIAEVDYWSWQRHGLGPAVMRTGE
jgi:hypothetical protein